MNDCQRGCGGGGRRRSLIDLHPVCRSNHRNNLEGNLSLVALRIADFDQASIGRVLFRLFSEHFSNERLGFTGPFCRAEGRRLVTAALSESEANPNQNNYCNEKKSRFPPPPVSIFAIRFCFEFRMSNFELPHYFPLIFPAA